jgi:hypothetical protein
MNALSVLHHNTRDFIFIVQSFPNQSQQLWSKKVEIEIEIEIEREIKKVNEQQSCAQH